MPPWKLVSSLALLCSWLAMGCSEEGGSPDGTSSGGGGASDAVRQEPGGGATGSGGDAGVELPEDFSFALTQSASFAASSEDFNNPERGFYQYSEILNWDFSSVASDGYSLVYSYVRLDDYRDAAIPQSLLDDLDAGLNAVRNAGIKVILRFAYNFGPWPDSEPDASKARILEHIAQVQPYLSAHEDVIAAMQAGFIGAWGEWHTSTNQLDNAADKREVLEALLEATPASRTVHVRYPPDKEEFYGGPLVSAQAFDGSHAARTGHHNDCFLSSDTDVGTYPSDQVETWKTYLEQDTKFVPMGGETCAVHGRGACPTATAEMARLHFSYLNRAFHTDVIDGWIAGGCYDEIRRSLGYRLMLSEAALPLEVRPGGAFILELELSNVGYAAPFNQRPLQVVLTGDSGAERATVSGVDVREWLPGAPIRLALEVQVPSSLAPGNYELGLALPDAAPTLAERSEYAIRLANEGSWRAESGVNHLGPLKVSPDALGDAAEVASLSARLND